MPAKYQPHHNEYRFRKTGRVENFKPGSSGNDDGVTPVDFKSDDPNVVTSAWYGNVWAEDQHVPVIDIDLDVHVFPSSTPGHHHLYIDRLLSKDNYFKLLKVMAEVGIIEQGYYEASVKRGYTTVRLPWVLKEEEINDTPGALSNWTERMLNLDPPTLG